MKQLILSFALLSFLNFQAFSQVDKFYSENGGEFIFSFADVEFNDQSINTPLRFTMFLHITKLYHYNPTSFAGLYTGYALRNIGYTTDFEGVKTKRRTYSFGIPLAIKLGALDKDFYVFGGASYELFFHYKQKQFIDGDKSKFSEWFSDRTDRFAPSFFAGLHFPGGFNLKFKYYPNDFLNRDFTGRDFGQEVDYADFQRTNMFYIGLSYYIRPSKFLKNLNNDSKETNYLTIAE